MGGFKDLQIQLDELEMAYHMPQMPHQMPPQYIPPQQTIRIEKAPNCWHEWKKDSFFSARVYETCAKCGMKKEEAEQEAFNEEYPF